MSQFLICKSKDDLAKYGMKISDVVSNKNLYIQVVNEYIKDKSVQDIWIINQIDDMITQLEDNMQIIEEISAKSELMIFWYGNDFQELDFIGSKQELMKYLKNNITNPCMELYLYVNLKNGEKEPHQEAIPVGFTR